MAVGDIVNINNPAYQPAVGVEIIVLIVFRGNSVGSHGLTDGVSTITNYGSGDSANTSLTKAQMSIDSKRENDMMKQMDVRILKGPRR